jgi:AcrR family transcriptional regulator
VPRRASKPSRESLLDTATEVFMEVGLSGARVDDIAHRARANKAMIYYHFGSKQGLYRAVLLRLFGALLEEVKRLRDREPDPAARLRALYSRVAALFEERPALPQIMLREVLSGGRGMDAEAAKTLASILGFVREAVEQGVARGAMRPVHPLLVHLSMLAPLLVYAAGRHFRERIVSMAAPEWRAPSQQELLAHLQDLLERDLQPEPRDGEARGGRSERER